MQIGKTACARAFEFRDRFEVERAASLAHTWEIVSPSQPCARPQLPFEPIPIQDASDSDISNWVAQCKIDHTVLPVNQSVGGSTAGYARWETFEAKHLEQYHLTRNDPLRGGVSRMSAYLHYGFVSPFRIARAAAARPGPGCEKYLDELLVWRELAFAFCASSTFCTDGNGHPTLAALPQWALETLETHRQDPRPANYSWETLARAQTEDELWNAAQRDLIRHGELHNNVRMTWGKAFLQWAESPERALQLAIDLNHRFALDGRDPASYGGILWCFGVFDRPFTPERKIYGQVRNRPTEDHTKRLDVPAYAKHTSRPGLAAPLRVGVIGAGISGLSCARALTDFGVSVEVFDKARGVGGRTSTRRHNEWAFDHGAQYFTARVPRFRQFVDSWLADGIVQEWSGRIVSIGPDQPMQDVRAGTQRLVGVPGMNAMAKHLAKDCHVTKGFRAIRIEREANHKNSPYSISSEDGRRHSGFDALVLSAPAAQTATLAAPIAPVINTAARGVDYSACWAVMVTFAEQPLIEFDGAFVNGSPLAWISRNQSKPGRGYQETWVLHANPAWSDEFFELPKPDVVAQLLAALQDATGVALPAVKHAVPHRWAYALPTTPLPEPSLFDAETRVGACGDWCSGPRIEAAFLSGTALAARIVANAMTRPVPTQRLLF